MPPIALSASTSRLRAGLAAAANALRSWALEAAALPRRGRPTVYIFESIHPAKYLGPAMSHAARHNNDYNANRWRGHAAGWAQLRGACGEHLPDGRIRVLSTVVTGKPNDRGFLTPDDGWIHTIRPFPETDFPRLRLGRLIHFAPAGE